MAGTAAGAKKAAATNKARHGKDFYALLEKELPDWKTRKKQLKS